ncbi:MAG TPA: dihydrofolate reductase family protein [Streptosporangiaceae bacterium]|nr:dihydrofolate reductase family protein [Streptosporangiaceae bacterium]
MTTEQGRFRRSLTVDMFVSLDGFAGGGEDWRFQYEPGVELQRYLLQVLEEPQVIVMGRRTYDDMASYWPRSSEPLAAAMNSLPKIVFSNTLTEPLAWHNSRLMKGDAVVNVRDLKAAEGDPLRCIGSISVATALFESGLVDQVRLVVFPIVLGATGTRPIFSRDSSPARLARVTATSLDSRVVVLDYRSGN